MRQRPLVVPILINFVVSLLVSTAPVSAQQPFTFTDATLTAGSSPVRTVHITELRTAINTMRAAAGLDVATFTDSNLSGVRVKRIHITELRAALDAVYTQVGQIKPTYTDTDITVGQTPIKRLHVVELRAAVNNVVVLPAFRITSLGTTSTTASQLITIAGNGFDPSANMRVIFTDANNRAVLVPAMNVTTTTLRVTVPPVVNGSGALSSGTVGVKVRKIAGTTTDTNTINLAVASPPTTGLPAGSVLKALLSGARSQSLALKNEPVAAAVKTQLDKSFTNNGLLLAKIQSVIDNPAATFSLGSADGKAITVDATNLAALDRVLLSMLQSMGSQPAATEPNTVPAANECMKAEAAAAATAGSGNTYSTLQDFMPGLYAAPRSSVNCNNAQGMSQGLNFVLGVGGVTTAGIVAGCAFVFTCPASVIALPTAALLYVTIVGIGGQIGLGGSLGQSVSGAGQFVQNGLKDLEKELQELVAGVVKLGDFLSFYNDVKDMTSAITTNILPPYSPPPPQTVTSIAITQTGTTTVAVITPAIANITVTYSLIGTDGYYLSGTRITNAAGSISFGVAPACGGVTDTVTVNVAGGPSATRVHVWSGACGSGLNEIRPRVPQQ